MVGTINILRTNPIGKYICSRINFSNIPVKQSSGTFLDIPYTSCHSKDIYYLYFTIEDQIRINDLIYSLFVIHFREIMMEGREMGLSLHNIVTGFIIDLKLHDDSFVYDRLMKQNYRNRRSRRLTLVKPPYVADN